MRNFRPCIISWARYALDMKDNKAQNSQTCSKEYWEDVINFLFTKNNTEKKKTPIKRSIKEKAIKQFHLVDKQKRNKTIPLYSFLIYLLFISSNIFSQTIEQRQEGKFLVRNHLNNDLEIVKTEKYTDDTLYDLYESIEYLPGGKIKNGSFFHQLYGYGNYVNGRLESGKILYLNIISGFDNSWYIDTKNKIFVRKDDIKTTYDKNNKPTIVYKSENGKWIPLQNYNEKKIVKKIVECHYAKLTISDFRLKGTIQIKKGLISKETGEFYEKTDHINDFVAELNFNTNGVLDGKQQYFKDVYFGINNEHNRDDRKISHIAIYENGRPLKYSKTIVPQKNGEAQVYIDSITFNRDDLKNSIFLYDNHILNHPQPTLVFNPFSGFVQLTNHYYFKNDEISLIGTITPDNANLKSLKHTINTHITNDLKKIIFKRSIEENSSTNDDLFFDRYSSASKDSAPDKDSNERKITFGGQAKIFYLKEQNIIDKIIKNDYSFVPYAFSWQKPGIKNANDISSIELLYWYEFMLKGSAEMHKTYFSKEKGINETGAEFRGYGNSSRYDDVSYLKKDLEKGVLTTD
ncbi:MAG: hypothetical protein RBT61_00010 [Candidatus Kapabacteria bacterium]|jgi:hypothetical protein|nr:hypothetical protein [Candidatus Kapabacteria bacterium]